MMEPQIVSDALLLAAPAVGTAANIVVQFALCRMARYTVPASIVAGIAAGGAVACAVLALALFVSPPAVLDMLGLALAVIAIYGAAAMAYFCLINLGETSLRIRMLQLVMDAPEGLTWREILAIYDDEELVASRLRRMAEHRRALVVDDVIYPRRSVLFAASWGLELLKRLLYGRRSTAAACGKENGAFSRLE